WEANGSGGTGVQENDASTGALVKTINLPGGHAGIVFDGTNIWVSSFNDGTVTEIRAGDSTVLRTIQLPANSNPTFMAFDGTHVWVTENSNGVVTEIDPGTGTILNNIATGSGPLEVACDGTYLWVTNNGTNTVQRILLADPSGSFTAITVGNGPLGLAF